MTEENEIIDSTNTQEPEVKWEPVAKVDTKKEHDPYEYAPKEVKDFHENYVKMWLNNKKGR